MPLNARGGNANTLVLRGSTAECWLDLYTSFVAGRGAGAGGRGPTGGRPLVYIVVSHDLNKSQDGGGQLNGECEH